MQKLFTPLFALAFVSGAFAQSPEKLSYQAVIRNYTGALVSNRNVGIRIQILQNDEFGAAVYVETHSVTTNENGLATIEIGGGTIVTGTFAGIDWSAGTYFLKTETDPVGEANYTIAGTSQILSVPYALYAKTAGNAFSGDYNDLENKPDFTGWDDNGLDDFNGNYFDLTNIPVIPAINDDATSTSSIWSSTKTKSELGTKADSTDVYTKTNLQTAGQAAVHYNNINNKPINLDEDKTDDVSITEDQIIGGNKTFSNTITADNGINSSNKSITNVGDPVSECDAVNKAYVDALKTQLSNIEDMLISSGQYMLIDIEGNQYKTVRIGNQVWMAENLKTTKFNDGSTIPNVTDSLEWGNLTYGAYCWYNNDEETFKNEYGALYNYYAIVDSRNLCPTDWHMPTPDEWATLPCSHCYSCSSECHELKEAGLVHWARNPDGSNETGFTALPGGVRQGLKDSKHEALGEFKGINFCAFFWKSNGDFFHISYNTMVSYSEWHFNPSVVDGYSVRCIKD